MRLAVAPDKLSFRTTSIVRGVASRPVLLRQESSNTMAGKEESTLPHVLDWPLVYGVVPAVLTGLGVLAGGVLLARRRRVWWVRVVPAAGGAAVVFCLLVVWVVDVLWRPFPDPLPLRVVVWGGVAMFAVALAVTSFWGMPWWRRGIAVLAAGLVLCTAAMKINAYYGQFPTLRAALGLPALNEVPFGGFHGSATSPHRPRPQRPLLEDWKPPATMPTNGVITQVAIPSPVSGFPAPRNAYLYLPPAYLATDRPLLPVLMMLHGQPGEPSNWVNGGQVAAIMDAFAATHHGLAPVVVMPDASGSLMGNLLCMDSKLGNSESYLTKDVPNWVKGNLQVDQDARHWAVGGFSSGGTCSLQLALRRPDVFASFIDISGQREPTLGTHKQTVDEAFGGDEERFRQVNPLDELATKTFPGTAGVFAAGSMDPYLPEQREVYAVCVRDGLNVRLDVVPGPHNWQVAAAGLQQSLDWLAVRTGLVGS